MRSRLALAFALSGCAGLVYETAWSRLLRLSFGATSEANATVLAAFMGGLALGSVWGGRLADRRTPGRALALFAACEVGVAALAIVSLMVLRVAPGAYVELERMIGAARSVRLLCAGLILLPPTVLMGMTLPLLSRACVGLGDGRGEAVGHLYAINTAGAVLGALATGFVLIPVLGIPGSIGAAAVANAAAAWLVRRLIPGAEVAIQGGATGSPALSNPLPGRRFLLAAAALSGAAALGLEVLWSRTLTLVVGSSTHAFALMLSTFLAGIASGSALYARLGARWRAAPLAGYLQLGVAASSVLLLRLATELPALYLSMWPDVHASPAGLLALRVVPAAILMFVPALLMGASLPALARAAARSDRADDGIGTDVGSIYAANTAGGIAGALLAALVALPLLGVARAAAAVACASLLAGALALSLQPRTLAILRIGAALAATVCVLWPTSWNPSVMGKGLAYLAPKLQPQLEGASLAQADRGTRIHHYRDGTESTVLVYDGGEGTPRAFVVNGRHEATSTPADMRNQYLLGHLPALLHRGPVREGLVIALGSGMTAGCLALHAQRVTVVELERDVIDAARTFAGWNHGAVGHPRVTIVVDDGRHHLLASRAQYDVITVDPIHPSVAGSDALYSAEQYQLVRARLAPGGIAAQWLPLYEMGVEDARAIARTFQEVFPDAQVWVAGSDAVLIGGAGTGPAPGALVRDALAQPGIAASLSRVNSPRLGTLLAALALDSAGTARYTAAAAVLRDDRPQLEFSLPWKMYARTTDANLLEIFRFAKREPQVDLAGLTEDEAAQVKRSFEAVQASLVGLALSAAGHTVTCAEFFQLALESDPDEAIARDVMGK